MNRFRLGLIGTILFVVILAILAPLFLEKIQPGYVGVVYKPGSGVQNQTLDDRWHWVSPFDKITEYPIRLQTVDAKDMTLATADGKNVSLDFSYSYAVSPDKVVSIFNKFGPINIEDIESSYLKKRLFDAARNVISKYTVLELYGEKSGEAQAKIKTAYTENVSKLGFMVDELTLGAPKPDQATQAAIDARVNASQELDRKKTELQIAEAEANRKRAEAKGNADSKVIEAEGTAKANQKLQQSITKELIEYETIKAWDGKLPTYQGAGNSIISIPGSK